jgi:short-subunit dehydrogenase
VVGYKEAMNKELSANVVKSVARCPGFVDTDMSDLIKESIDAAE